jgi:hypothetical protein
MRKEIVHDVERWVPRLQRFLLINIDKLIGFKDEAGYVHLEPRHNRILFYLLHQAGFFNFHVTNKGFIVSRHQVVAYANFGFRAYLNGFVAKKNEVTVHHLNSTPGDDRASNLEYASPTDNLLCAEASRTSYRGKVESTQPTIFNRQGKRIKDHIHHLLILINRTIDATVGACIPYTKLLMLLDVSYGKTVERGYPKPFYVSDALFFNHSELSTS